MTKTFDQSLIDTAVISMSMIDPEDMQDTSSEEFLSLRRIQQGCHTELTNREDFPFNKFSITIDTQAGQNESFLPDGTVLSVWLKGSSKPLDYIPDITMQKEASGTPYAYGITYNPDLLVFYPTPIKAQECVIKYLDTKNVLDATGNPSFEITVGSTLRMPERIQPLYFDALEYRVLFEYMRKQSNPRWQPTEQLFNEKWKAFLKATKPTDTETYFTI